MALLELYLVVAVHNLGLLVVVFSSVVVLSSGGGYDGVREAPNRDPGGPAAPAAAHVR